MKRSAISLAALALTSLLAACAGNKVSRGRADDPSARPARPQLTETSLAVDSEPDVRDMTAYAVPELKEVRFSYDSDHLDSAARFSLKANAAYLNEHPIIKIQIAGHCDQRGTVPYNLALGQRRARSARDFYRLLGVDASRVATISYGAERLVCSEASDSCWTLNRRAETLVMADKTIAGSPGGQQAASP